MSKDDLWGLDTDSIVKEHGTPTYIVNLDLVKKNFKTLSNTVRRVYGRFKIFYAVKANPLISILKLVRGLGGGAEVVSLGELEASRRAGLNGEEVLFNGPGKTSEEIESAISFGTYSINVESVEELRMVREMAGQLGVKAGVGFRVNPCVKVATHKYLALGFGGSKFGLDAKSYKAALSEARRSEELLLRGIQMHIGSQIFRVSDFQKGFLRLLKLVNMFKSVLGFPPGFIDIGGGIGLNYETGDTSVSLSRFSKALSGLVNNPGWPDGAKLILEPGRALVGNAGILLTRVLYVKKSNGRQWAIIDAGINDFMRTALYGVKHRVVSLTSKHGSPVRYALGGPICESSDVLGEYHLPRLRRGDLLALLDVGAYGCAMSSNYNGRPRPPTVVLQSGKVRLAEKRESIDDILRRQVVN
ncbi:MAG: diaminopimelate decarboxylase [Candidatus Brockarchaeota archaeon]|nr:diaminopimelate decarboxylase [Candidatus Brockarchaeota archaeon]MBO3809316.1 diaminopimelate decarboxylase [Candidatus Brockarchaeota archaeon]